MMRIQFANTYIHNRGTCDQPKRIEITFKQRTKWNIGVWFNGTKKMRWNEEIVTISEIHLLVARIRHFFGIVSIFFFRVCLYWASSDMNFRIFLSSVVRWYKSFSSSLANASSYCLLSLLLSGYNICTVRKTYHLVSLFLCSVINCKSSLIYKLKRRKTKTREYFSFRWKRVCCECVL